jgi:hypothetical protein
MSSRERGERADVGVFAVAFSFARVSRHRLENGLVLTALGPLKGDLHLLHRVSALFSVERQKLKAHLHSPLPCYPPPR